MRPVDLRELPAIWPRIRPALEKIIARHGSDGWLPEDVYAIVCAGNATLYVNDGDWIGFCVLQVMPSYTQKRLHVWLLHLESDPEPFMGRLKQVARNCGASKITFSTARKGWERRAARLGFRPGMQNYEQEVSE
jgi:hypothetical protein